MLYHIYRNTLIHKLFIGTLILSTLFLVAADYPGRGTEDSKHTCPGGVIVKGDLMRDVYTKCGEPLEETRIASEPYDVLLYRFSQRYVYYFAFMHERLQRIYAVNCLEKDPYCE